jgi:hypothetical protein
MTKCDHCSKWCGGTEDRDYFTVPDSCWEYYTTNRWFMLCLRCYRTLVDWKDGGEFERCHGKPALTRYRYGEGLVPVPDGGWMQLACMSEEERAAFFDYARDCGMWDWIKAKEEKWENNTYTLHGGIFRLVPDEAGSIGKPKWRNSDGYMLERLQ